MAVILGKAERTLSKPDIHQAELESLEAQIKQDLDAHFDLLELRRTGKGTCGLMELSKNTIRLRHSFQRQNKQLQSLVFIQKNASELLRYFASGKDIKPNRIKPRLQMVQTNTIESRLFRFATLTWSIPVSEGFGRRMRFLVWDDHNHKLIGVIALGDPVFNLKARDEAIGWSGSDRKERLVDVMDAYVMGALPPYNMLLGGKLIACLVRTREIISMFSEKYGNTVGIISGKAKQPYLLVVTTTSALGRSSVYNRLRLDGRHYFRSVGYTSGYGHFHIPDDLFAKIREYLKFKGHNYYSNNRYGNGPNWRLRSIRAAMELIGINRDFLRHGVRREVFICEMASNTLEILRGAQETPDYQDVCHVTEVAEQALERWVRPRAFRMPEYKDWHRDRVIKLVLG